MEALRLRKKYPEVSQDELFDLINRFKYVECSDEGRATTDDHNSAISTDTPGRVDKTNVLQALQSSGESYDRARETLKHVSVDASGKVELEDWVEVRHSIAARVDRRLRCCHLKAQCEASATSTCGGTAVQGR